MRKIIGALLVSLIACSKDATGPAPVALSLQIADTAYAHGAAILGVLATPAQAGATVTLWAGDGTLASAGAGHWSWTVDPQLSTHALYGCAATSGACSLSTDTLKLGQLPHDPSVLVTSSVTAGYVEIFWRTATDSADTVLSSPIPAPGVCIRFTTPPGDSAQWRVAANDSTTDPTHASTVTNYIWWGADSLPAWTLGVSHADQSTPTIQLNAVVGGTPC